MLNYEEVPNDILTGKDLDYLSDMFQWNYEALKRTNTALTASNDDEVCGVLDKAINLFDTNLNSVLSVLESRGNTNE